MRRAILNEQWLNGYVVNSNLPIGAPMAWLSEVPPVGFLAFDGSEYNQEDFPELYEVVKNIPSFHSYTEGKFKIPNLKGRVLQGADTVIGELIEAGLPNIEGNFRHTTTGGNGLEVNGAFSNFTISGVQGNVGGQYTGNGVKFDASKGETKTDGTLKTEDEPHVYGNSDTVQPPAFTVRWVIKATNYVSLEKNAIDDTKTTNANAWSAAKTQAEIDAKQKYSTEEKVIGEWIDGKPIYRRILDYSTTPTPASLDVTSWNIDTPISIKGSLGNTQDKSDYVLMLPYNDGQSQSMFCLTNYCKSLSFMGTSNRYGYVILEYTKTTD